MPTEGGAKENMKKDLYIDYDGIFRDYSHSIVNYFIGRRFDSYDSDLYGRYRKEVVGQKYLDNLNWQSKDAKLIIGSDDMLKKLRDSNLFNSISLLTSQPPGDVIPTLLSMCKFGIINGDELPDIIKEDMANRAMSDNYPYLDYYEAGEYEDKTVSVPNITFTRKEYPGLLSKDFPFDSIIFVNGSDLKPDYLKDKPGILIDDRLDTLLKIKPDTHPTSYGIWVIHLWTGDVRRFTTARPTNILEVSLKLKDINLKFLRKRLKEISIKEQGSSSNP